MAIKDKFYQRIRKVLVKHGALDEAKAEEAAGIADRENRSYADVLLERDMVDEMGYLSAISMETNIPPVDVPKSAANGSAPESEAAVILTPPGSGGDVHGDPNVRGTDGPGSD